MIKIFHNTTIPTLMHIILYEVPVARRYFSLFQDILSIKVSLNCVFPTKLLKCLQYRINMVLGKFLLRKFHLGKFHLENSSNGKFLLRCFGATLFWSWLASLAVGLRTLVSQVRAQRHSRIACYIVFP